MDLLDFDVDTLYFDQHEDERIDALLKKAAANYSDDKAEFPLLQAYFLAPDSLNVLIALNRFYYYQHKLQNALIVASRSLNLIRIQLDFPKDWQHVNYSNLQSLPENKITTLRMYLFALKSIGFLNMRLDNLPLSQAIFVKLVELDSEDRIGAKGLLELVDKALQEQQIVTT